MTSKTSALATLALALAATATLAQAAEVSRSATSVSKTVRIQRKRYTISTRLRWTSPRKARGWVQVEGPGCNAERKRFTVVAG